MATAASEGRKYVGLAGQHSFETRVKMLDKMPILTQDDDVLTAMQAWEKWIEAREITNAQPSTQLSHIQNSLTQWKLSPEPNNVKQQQRSSSGISLTVATLELLSTKFGRALYSTSGVIDLRSRREFDEKHFPHTTSMSWQASDLDASSFKERAHELPFRGSTLALLSNKADDLHAAAATLLRRGYAVSLRLIINESVLEGIFGPHEGEPRWQPTSRPLWQASDCLRNLVPKVEESISPAFKAGGQSLAVDVGCGGGRESMLLLQRGWKVFAVDIHDNKRFNAILGSLGEAPAHWSGTFPERCEYRQLDLESAEGLNTLLSGPTFGGSASAGMPMAQLVWVGRYLHRPLLTVIRDQIVAPGGAVIYHTFCKGCEKFGRPKKDRFLLRPGELAAIFEGWQIIVDEIRPISDGRPCSFFCAVKPCGDDKR